MQRLLKSFVRQLARNIRVPIRSGPCEGCLWSLPTRMQFLRGVYEARLANFVAETLRPDDVFWDVGAHFGYYSLLASRVVTDGQCYSFEPDPANRWFLESHVRWNLVQNISVFPFAIAANCGTRTFGGNGTGAGHLDGAGQTVQTRSVDALIESHACRPPSFMKIDVEGAEAEVLRGRFLTRGAGIICVATHSPELHAGCGQLLAGHGFEIHDPGAPGFLVAVSRARPDCDFVMKRTASLHTNA